MGSYLYQVHLHHRPESYSYGRSFTDDDIYRIGSPSPSIGLLSVLSGDFQTLEEIFAEDTLSKTWSGSSLLLLDPCNNVAYPRCMLFILKALLILATHNIY